MYIIKPHFDYCPIQKTEYFVNVKYKISDVNTYKKVSMECVISLTEKLCTAHRIKPVGLFVLSGLKPESYSKF